MQHYEGCSGEDSEPIHPTSQENFLVYVATKGINEDPLAERGPHGRNSFRQKFLLEPQRH
jgi:hypothetical protein